METRHVLTSLVASRTSTSSATSISSGLRGRLWFDAALGAAHGGLVDRLHGGLGCVILLIIA